MFKASVVWVMFIVSSQSLITRRKLDCVERPLRYADWSSELIMCSTRYGTSSERTTVRCSYKRGQFYQNIYKRHSIARPLGRGMGCFLWIRPLLDILLLFLWWCIQYLVILDRVIMARDCNCYISLTMCPFIEIGRWLDMAFICLLFLYTGVTP